MNERLKELWWKARIGYNNQNCDPEVLAKFAELIVRECIGCCEQVISDPVPKSVDTWLNGGTQCIDEIKLQFGVEENAETSQSEPKRDLMKGLWKV